VLEAITLKFEGALWHWKGPAPWYFVTVPAPQCEELQEVAPVVTYGWGMIPVQAQTGRTTWRTSLFPKDGYYLVPIKASVRQAEGLAEGDTVAMRLEVRL
jgi:hypothetical protein